MKAFKSILLLTLVFLTGLIVGVVGTRVVVRHVMRNAILHPENVQTILERNLTRKLQLDNEQQIKLHEILSDARGQLRDLRRQYRPQLVTIISNANEQITAILTPEQQDEFESVKVRNHPLLQAAELNH
jgi:Spy/CpxP family protein refolding chaperone